LDKALTRWNERIARARHLSRVNPATAELLTFYAAIATYQRTLVMRWSGTPELRASHVAISEVPAFLDWLAANAPSGLSASVPMLRDADDEEWEVLLEDYVDRHGADAEPQDALHAFVLEALLQPLAELQATRAGGPRGSGPHCPVCDSLPVVGVLREEGEGAKRNLVCGLCFTEWKHLRLVCVSCDEKKADSLPVFTAQQLPGARVEACDTCQKYLKTLDATKDGLIIPVVDDLATMPLDLWAREQGYTRVRSNLLAR
jgi:FdhE protein